MKKYPHFLNSWYPVCREVLVFPIASLLYINVWTEKDARYIFIHISAVVAVDA
jgi:hypothetical protein